ncbi:MAG: ABC transporter ATP-binding protein [Candidatus Melainabacteria bacterium]|nr:ABC transporter ATP-binding protein [Candidatus Melainabacteria bacterium]
MQKVFFDYIVSLLKTANKKIALALLLMVFLSFTEGVGLMLLLPILQLIGIGPKEASSDRVTGFIIDFIRSSGVDFNLISVLGIYVMVITLHALTNQYQSLVSFSIEHDYVLNLRQKLYKAILNSNWLFSSRCKASDFTHALTTEIERVGSGTVHLLQLVVGLFVVFVYLILSVQFSLLMTTIAFAGGLLLLFLQKKKLLNTCLTGEELSIESSGLYAACIEHFSSIKTTKSYNAEEHNLSIFAETAKKVSGINIKHIKNQVGIKCMFEIGTVIVLSIFVFISFQVLNAPASNMLLLFYLFTRIVPRFLSIQENYHEILAMLPAFKNVTQLISLCEQNSKLIAQSNKQIIFKNSIVLKDVSFGYDLHTEQKIFLNLNLTIKFGETTSIVGSSGSGKSTIADLVIGLLIPQKGSIIIDDLPLVSEFMKSWRDQIGYVSQDTFLFHDTIRTNLLWACPGASEEEIKNALKLAQAYDFVSKLRNGLNTVIGDRGALLSSGERQRLALARALLRRPALLVLDEATNHLDVENERRIQNAINELHGTMTILHITHRLSTVQKSDIIYVIEAGQIIESGNWNRLNSKESGRFHKLCLT